jgi:hypothetical protein
MDHENLEALTGLQQGNVEPLITLLEDTDRSLHPEVRRWLALMLMGDLQTRWWLACKKHPGFTQPDDNALLFRNLAVGMFIHSKWSAGEYDLETYYRGSFDRNLCRPSDRRQAQSPGS